MLGDILKEQSVKLVAQCRSKGDIKKLQRALTIARLLARITPAPVLPVACEDNRGVIHFDHDVRAAVARMIEVDRAYA